MSRWLSNKLTALKGKSKETPPSSATEPRLDTTSILERYAVVTDGNRYKHEPLTASRHIRVLHLHPSPIDTSELSCELKELSLDDSPEFEALSYTWGTEQSRHGVKFPSGVLFITPNCATALLHLRQKTERRVLWIDSICINQDSLDERSQQVQLMGEIYFKAKSVVVWLGESDKETVHAIQRIRDFGNLEKVKDSAYQSRMKKLASQMREERLTKSPINSLEPLLGRQYFQRMWCVQEIILANASSVTNVMMWCGHESFTWSTLMLAVDRLKVHGYHDDHSDAIDLHRHLFNMVMGHRHPQIKALLDSKADPKNHIRGGDVMACQILWYARRQEATDPKDKVYALYGLFRELGVEIAAPDYNKTVEDIYCESAAACLRHDRDRKYLLLPMAPTLNRMATLPSWVPDWSDKGWTHEAGQALVTERVTATASSQFIMTISDDNRKLTMPGKIIDRIVYCGQTLTENLEEIMKNPEKPTQGLVGDERTRAFHRVFQVLKGWVQIMEWNPSYPTGESNQEVLRRTLLQNSRETDNIKIDLWYKIMTASDLEVMTIALKRLTGKTDTIEVIKAMMEQVPEDIRTFFAVFSKESSPFHTNAYSFSRDRTFFLTERGYVGTAPGEIVAGDGVALFSGVELPLIVRADGEYYRLRAHAYVHGVMQGQAWEAGKGLEDITLI